MPQDGPQKVPGGRFIRVFQCRRGARTLIISVFTCQRGPRRAQEADSYVFFLRVFLESGRGPRRPEDAPGCPPEGPRRQVHTCFHVPERHQDADDTCF